MRRILKKECRHRGLLKQKRITEAECKGKERKRKCKKRNAKREMQKEKCRNDIRTPRMNEEKYAEYRYKKKIPCIQLNP